MSLFFLKKLLDPLFLSNFVEMIQEEIEAQELVPEEPESPPKKTVKKVFYINQYIQN